MDHVPIDVLALRESLGWTQQQLADFCDTDRSTVSKWEKEPPSKGPAVVLLRQLRDQDAQVCLDGSDTASLPVVDPAGPAASQAGAGVPVQEAAE